MKFENEMKRVALALEAKHNMSVLQCVYNENKLDLDEDEIVALNLAHLKKIQSMIRREKNWQADIKQKQPCMKH